MILIKQIDDEYVIKFKYDPRLVALIKNVPNRRWNPTDKYWSIPKAHLGFLLNELKGTEYENTVQIESCEYLNQNATLDPTDCNSIPDIDISDMKHYVQEGGHLYAHQITFLKYAKSRAGRGFILSDDMGLGKTIEVINYALYMKETHNYKHCLIICCVNSAKFSWAEDIRKHTNGAEQGYILGTRKKRNGGYRYSTSGKDKIADLEINHMYGDLKSDELPYFLIVNIESLRAKEGKKFTLESKIIELIKNHQINLIPVDEIHKNASPKSMQGKLILDIKKQTEQLAEWIPMTGTPIVNKPTDVYTPLRLINGHKIKSYYMWLQQFCVYGGYGGHEIMSYKNIPMLKDMLQSNMLRRLKTDVLDLPDKIYYDEYVENTPIQEKMYEDLRCSLLDREDEIINSMNPLTEMLRLRQINGFPEIVDSTILYDENYLKKNAKLVRLIEIVDDIVERGEKCVIFSNWIQALKPVYKYLSNKYKVACFMGNMSVELREKNKRVFINNPNYKIMLGTVGAMGVSLTLTVANNVIFYDEPWTAADKHQCEDRCHRLTSDSNVNIYTILSKDTIDEAVHKIVYEKADIANYIVDGQLNLKKNPELFEKLLGKNRKD